MYVDNTDLFVVGRSPKESADSIIKRTRELVNIWCRSIWATGGLLRPDKCFWYFMDFKWNGSAWEYVQKDDIEYEIAIPNLAGENEVVKLHNPDFAEETLGVFLAVDGNMRQEKEKLSKASSSWTRKIVCSGLFRNEVVMAITTTISRTWQYPISTTTFTPDDCEDIMKPLYSEILPKLGSSRNIPLEYRYAPSLSWALDSLTSIQCKGRPRSKPSWIIYVGIRWLEISFGRSWKPRV